ncbi:hypothetical protein OXX80_007548 [Metschnikowia pulcherrima]
MKAATYEIEIDSDGFQKVKGRRSMRTAHAIVPEIFSASKFIGSSLPSNGTAEILNSESDAKYDEKEQVMKNDDAESEWESTEASSNTLTSTSCEDQQNHIEKIDVENAKAETNSKTSFVGATPETVSETKSGFEIRPKIESSSILGNDVIGETLGYTTESGMDVDSEEKYEDAVQYVKAKIFDEDGFQLVTGRRMKNMSQNNVSEKANAKSQNHSNGKTKNGNPQRSAANSAKPMSPYTILLTIPDKPGRKRNRKRASYNGVKGAGSDAGADAVPSSTPQAKQTS